MRGEVLARWQEFVGAGRADATLQARLGRWRDRLAAALSGGATPGQDLADALESGLVLLVDNAAERAAEDTATAWRADAAGAELLRRLRERADRLVTRLPGGRGTHRAGLAGGGARAGPPGGRRAPDHRPAAATG